jgi:hypothetical protein
MRVFELMDGLLDRKHGRSLVFAATESEAKPIAHARRADAEQMPVTVGERARETLAHGPVGVEPFAAAAPADRAANVALDVVLMFACQVHPILAKLSHESPLPSQTSVVGTAPHRPTVVLH